MWTNGSIFQSEWPASSTRTLVPPSAVSRLATAQPAEPPPTITTSYCSLAIALPASAPEPALLGGAHVVPDVLGLAVLGEAVLAELAADAGLLVAAPLGLGDVGVVVVDPDRAHPQPRRHPLCLAGVLGPHRTGKAVDAVVGDGDGLVLVGEGLDGEHRAEGLLLGDRHATGAAVEDRRQVVEAAVEGGVVGRPATAPQHGTLLEPLGDVRRDLLAVGGADQRTGLGLLVARATEPDGLRPLDQPVDERVADALLDQQPGTGRADLAGVEEDGGEGVVERDLEVGVGEDDVGVLAAELERHLLHRRCGR